MTQPYKDGYFLEPTVVEAAASHRISKEEVFGPFLTVTRFKDDEEALAEANSTIYGLGSGLWTNNLTRAHRFADQIHAGMVWINSYKRVHPASPFGGVVSRAMAAKWALKPCANIPKPNPFGSMSMRQSRLYQRKT